MEDRDIGRMKIIEESKIKEEYKKALPWGTVVYCKGKGNAESFYGIVYAGGVLELPYGSDAYIRTENGVHLGDKISYWIIARVCKNVKLIV